jgi:sugar transferase (PEP-CTERM/EpsH1 system associated)
MKILFVSSRFPYPPVKGDQVILHNRLRHLSKKHQITLLTFYQNDRELSCLDQVRPYCKRIETIRIGRVESIFNLLFSNPFSRLPLQSLYFASDKFRQRLEQVLKSEDFDVVHTYLLRMAEYTKDIAAPKILELIDCMQLNLEKRLSRMRYPQKILYREELRRISGYEREIIKEYDAAIVVSDADRNYLGLEGTVAIPLGIDTDRYKRVSPLPHNRTIIFSGNMAYYPNESAIVWFITQCFAEIKRRVPGVRLKIVGINPGSGILKYHDGKDITVTGFVESIIDELVTAQVAIAPMQSGYGMHIKILEAMSCGLPVVTTPSGKGTITAEDGVHLRVAEEGPSFAEACIDLLNDPERARALGGKGRELVVREYSWESSMAKLERVYQAVVGRREVENHESRMQNFT